MMSTTTTSGVHSFGSQLHASNAATTAAAVLIATDPMHHGGGLGAVAFPCVKPDILLNTDYGLFAVYRFVKNFIGASGTSAVAIDNKIEQAMDLVKSHLMFAVREEVEVLKEKIAELMDRINQLELENTILKANATQDTLIQLSSMVATPAMQTAKSLPNNAANPTNGPIS